MWYGALWSAHGSWCGDALLHHSDGSDSNNPQTPFARAAVGCVLLLERFARRCTQSAAPGVMNPRFPAILDGD
jgi:hypothetical protein